MVPLGVILTRAGLPARSDLAAPGKDFVPNPRRPSNPFTPTTEPDWIVVPKYASSPSYRGPSTPSSTLSKSSPQTSATSLHRIPSGRGVINGGASSFVPPLPSRASSFASSTSSSASLARKPAPPVPKKPVLLSSQGSQRSSFTGGSRDMPPSGGARIAVPIGQSQKDATSATMAGLAYRPSARQTDTMELGFPSGGQTPPTPPPRGSRRVSQSLDGGGGLPPSLPPRTSSSSKLNTSGLMDEVDDGAKNIPSLQPRRVGR